MIPCKHHRYKRHVCALFTQNCGKLCLVTVFHTCAIYINFKRLRYGCRYIRQLWCTIYAHLSTKYPIFNLRPHNNSWGRPAANATHTLSIITNRIWPPRIKCPAVLDLIMLIELEKNDIDGRKIITCFAPLWVI